MTDTRKMYVLDTSVLLSSPKAMLTFAEHEVVLPLVVIKELEAKRHDPDLGYSARIALRTLEDLRTTAGSDLRTGVPVNPDGGTVRIEINHIDQSGLPDALRADRSNDNRILAVANNFKIQGRDVTVVTKDMPMRILAETLGLKAEEYLNEQVFVTDAYTGFIAIDVTTETVEAIYRDEPVDLAEAIDLDHVEDLETILSTPTNTGVRVNGPSGSALAILTPDKELVRVHSNEAFGVSGRSAEQRVALNHLLNPDIGIVSLAGAAGTGKTFMALAAGLEQVIEQQTYKKVIVFRPLYAVGGQDLGYLPGTAEEKMSPWGAAIFDALESMTTRDAIDAIVEQGQLEVLPLTHIRGRSLNDAYVIVDEAQSLERPVLLTALSRLGTNAKVVLSWDAAQRDNLRVGRYDGMAAVVERLKGESLFAHTTFTRSERGPVAALVTRLMDDFGN